MAACRGTVAGDLIAVCVLPPERQDPETLTEPRYDPHEIEGAALLSIKTGACPEDCAYCPQSARNETDLQPEPLMELPDILAKAEQAKAEGATRFCMGTAWRSPNDR